MTVHDAVHTLRDEMSIRKEAKQLCDQLLAAVGYEVETRHRLGVQFGGLFVLPTRCCYRAVRVIGGDDEFSLDNFLQKGPAEPDFVGRSVLGLFLLCQSQS